MTRLGRHALETCSRCGRLRILYPLPGSRERVCGDCRWPDRGKPLHLDTRGKR